MTEELFDYIISEIIKKADESKIKYEKEKSKFNDGKIVACYEILDIIKSRLIEYDCDLSKCGLDIDLDIYLS